VPLWPATLTQPGVIRARRVCVCVCVCDTLCSQLEPIGCPGFEAPVRAGQLPMTHEPACTNMDTFATFMTRAGAGVSQELLEGAWRASGRRVATALAILEEIKAKATRSKPAPAKPVQNRQTSLQPKLSFAAAGPSVSKAGVSSLLRPPDPAIPLSRPPPSRIPPDTTLPGSRPRIAQPCATVDLIDLVSDDEEPAVRSSWPRSLPLLSILGVSLVRGDYPTVLPTTALAVWHEVSAAGLSGTKRGRSKPGLNQWHAPPPTKTSSQQT